MARITVVNDYPDFLEAMNAILAGVGNHTVTGFNGDETSLEQVVGTEPQLLVVDLRMAGEDIKGWDMLMMARADERLRDVPLVVCSADVRTLRDRADEFRRLGIYSVEKPFTLDQVLAVVESALDGSAS